MTTRRLRLLSVAMVPCMVCSSLLAAPIGRPTPAPCTADGACSPARATWGYHGTRWRTWPGTDKYGERDAEQPPAGSEYITPSAPPDPRSEDKLAPPKVEALDETPAESPSDAADFPMPEMTGPENGTDEAADADAEGDRFAPPRPGFMDRAPGTLPFDEPAGGDAPAGGPGLPFGQPPAPSREAPQPPADLFPSNLRSMPARPVASEDAPPQLPFNRPASRQPSHSTTSVGIVLPAAAAANFAPAGRPMVSPIPVAAPQHRRVERAAALHHVGDAPPQLPPSLRSMR